MAETSIQDAGAADRGKSNEYLVGFLCCLVLVLEGYDLGAMAFTLPALADAWHLKPVAFTGALTAASFGLFVGSFLCGMLGDRLGRKPVLMGAVALFGVTSFLTAMTRDPFWLAVTRFLTGLGIGGGIPTTIALLSDLARPGKQGGLVMASMCGVQIGNVVSGVAAARLIAHMGWPAVFVLGGLLPLFILPVLAFLLPETFVARKTAGLASVPRLFEGGFARLTLILWLVNFLSLLTIYSVNSWLPSLLHSMGIMTTKAILASSMFQLGGMTGCLASAPLTNRYGTENVVAVLLAIGGCFLIVLGVAHGTALVFAALAFGAGLGISAGQVGINALSGAVYPAELRGTGAGWALGVGRLGNIAGPLFGGLLLALSWRPGPILMLMAVPAFALTMALLLLRHTRASAPPTI
ncbi:MAG TPA: MFS transporter [Rhizomicrobium sp.]|nr:MFS transporter [Rhizomicrobium sp.]